MVLLEFTREYQTQGLRDRCAEVLSEVVAKTPEGDCRLLDLLVVASEHCLTDHLQTLIPRVAQLKTAVIEQFHGKVDHGVLAAIYLAKSKKSEAIMKSFPRPKLVAPHIFTSESRHCETQCLTCQDYDYCRMCSLCKKYACPCHESSSCAAMSSYWPAAYTLRCQHCWKAHADGCACAYSCCTDLIAHMKIG